MEFRFTNEIPASQTDRVVNHLIEPRLWIAQSVYPGYLDWAHRVHTQLLNGDKRAMVAYHGRDLVGVTIYQQHPTDPTILEGKNISVRPEEAGRHIAAFLVRQTEIEGARDLDGVNKIIWDAKADNLSVRNFLLAQHYVPTGPVHLYGSGTGEDTVYKKSLSPLRPKR